MESVYPVTSLLYLTDPCPRASGSLLPFKIMVEPYTLTVASALIEPEADASACILPFTVTVPGVPPSWVCVPAPIQTLATLSLAP